MPDEPKPKKKRSLCTSNGNDVIFTPDALALAIVRHFAPLGTMLEPCAGGGAFLRAFDVYNVEMKARHPDLPEALTRIDYIDIKPPANSGIPQGDFLNSEHVENQYDWLITNPPWSLFTDFLRRAMQVADNVVFLDKFNAWGFNLRMRMIEEAGFQFKAAALIPPVPPPWQSMGLHLAAVHIQRKQRHTPEGHLGTMTISRIAWDPKSLVK